jgi:septal ring factor EnvC (AmiA/AmiB activator)
MTLSHTEKSVINHLTNKGAATKFELKEALNGSKGGVQSAVARLMAIGRVEATPVKKKHNSLRGHVVYRIVAAQPKVASVNVFEHPEIYTRLNGLESKLGRLNHSITDLEKALTGLAQRESSLNTRLNKTIKYVNDFEIERIRIEDGIRADRSRLDGFAARLIALETPQPAIDPLYTEIKQYFTDQLGSRVSPELLGTMIDEAYAERIK